MYIDCHVHLRDFNEKYKETIKHGLEVALDSGVDAVCDMPNTNPPILNEETVKERISLAKNSGVKEVSYYLYIGLTSNREQVKHAIDLAREYTEVIGIKMYAGHSTNNLGIIKEEDQQMIYETLANEGYEGILAVHCEKESNMNHKLWNHSKPFTHCLARPEKAEIESIKDQIKFAELYNFKGKLHIAHISSPRAVEIVNKAKSKLDISCGVCPHHLIFDWSKMFNEHGIMYKVNPPLRSDNSRKKMLDHLKEGKINWIETDHAPHSVKDKINNHLSGIIGLPHWPLFHEFLRKNNFSEDEIEKLTFSNVMERFELDVDKSRRKTKDRTYDYGFNYYESLEEELNEV